MTGPQAGGVSPKPSPEISRDEIRARVGDASLALLNVLPHEAFAAGHIPGSISLPVAEIPGRAHTLLLDAAQDIAVYCASPT